MARPRTYLPVVLAAAVLLVAPQPTTVAAPKVGTPAPAPALDDDTRWVAVGDSVMSRATDDIEERMTRRFGPGYTDVGGARQPFSSRHETRTDTSMEAVRRALRSLGGRGILVVQEDGRYVKPGVYRRFVRRVAAVTPSLVRVVWMMPTDLGPKGHPDAEARRERAATHRRTIRTELTEHRRSAIAPWWRVVQDRPRYTPDGRHPACGRAGDPYTRACRAYSWIIVEAAL